MWEEATDKAERLGRGAVVLGGGAAMSATPVGFPFSNFPRPVALPRAIVAYSSGGM